MDLERLSLEYGLQSLLRWGSLNFMAVSSGVTSALFPFDLFRLGLALLGGGGLSGPGVEPPLLDPDAGVLSGGHLPKGGMSTACVEAEDVVVGVVSVFSMVGEELVFFLISRSMVSRRDLITLFSLITRIRASPVLPDRVCRFSWMDVMADLVSALKRKESSSSAALSLAMERNSAASYLQVFGVRRSLCRWLMRASLLCLVLSYPRSLRSRVGFGVGRLGRYHPPLPRLVPR